ncbi:MAG: 5-formyltetrahydrofolate cyclo-ligase [Spirochaetales bacterium]|jgi:5-formyltetrahydrofolate cyclo-ligase|nr:5-formyltetrahydrofolate cyclo-ligase [Spirochaetales bacterium]
MVEDKKTLRRHMRGILASIGDEQRTVSSSSIVEQIGSSMLFAQCTHLFAYMALKQEVDVSGLIDLALRSGRQVALPRCRTDYSLDYHWIVQDEKDWKLFLEEGPYRLKEPISLWPKASIQDNTLILVPALAFTRSGERLGKGKGYYDRFLSECTERCIKLGVAFETQIVPALPVHPHDTKVDAIVTEEGFIYCV